MSDSLSPAAVRQHIKKSANDLPQAIKEASLILLDTPEERQMYIATRRALHVSYFFLFFKKIIISCVKLDIIYFLCVGSCGCAKTVVLESPTKLNLGLYWFL